MNQFRNNKIPLDWELWQRPSRKFINASSSKLTRASAVTTLPLTFCCWVKSTSGSTTQTLFSLANNSGFDRHCLQLDSGKLYVSDYVSGFITAYSTRNYPVSGWFHAAYVCASVTSRACYLDGGNKGLVTTSGTPTTPTLSAIGRVVGNGEGGSMAGDVALPAFWNAALSDAEIKSLADGAFPWSIRPQNLVACPNLATLYDPVVRGAWTSSNTTIVNPPRQLFTAIRRNYFIPTAATGNRLRRFLITAA